MTSSASSVFGHRSAKSSASRPFAPLRALTASAALLQSDIASYRASSSSRLPFNESYKGQLTASDRPHPNRPNYRADIFSLGQLQVGQTVKISLRSGAFDPMLQLVDKRSGRIVLSNDDRTKSDRNSYLQFTVERPLQYQLLVTSFDAGATGRYSLKVIAEKVANPPFNFRAGYGLVNAAAAVAAAVQRNPFADVPDASKLWGLDAINVPEVWAQGFTGKGVTVAVLDTGVNYKHKDLKDHIWKNPGEIPNNGLDDDSNGYIDDVRGWDFVNNDNDPTGVSPHGTHVAGTIAASKNGFGVTGVAYNAKILPLQVLKSDFDNRSIRAFDQGLANSIRYAVDNGARVLNLSLGGGPLIATRRALEYAYKAGAIAVMAAGNYGFVVSEPAAFAKDNLGIAVGAIKENRDIPRFSNPAGREAFPFLMGPGVRIKSTIRNNRYASYSGTSMATPHVAGVVALMLSANPDLTPDQVRKILIKTANPDGVNLFR